MKNTEQKIPALRFPEFSGEWEEKKLGEVGSTFNGLSGKTADDFGEGEPYIQYKQIFDKTCIDIKKCAFVYIANDEKQSEVQYGDIFFTTSSETPHEVGMSSVMLEKLENKMFLNSFCFGYRPNSLEEIYPVFSQYLFRSPKVRKDIIKLAQGSTRYNMSKVAFLKNKISYPCLEEQTQIADFLSATDKRLQLLKEKKTKLEEYKRGVMQRIFSQELRFTRPDGSVYPDWEEKRLGEVSEILRGTSFPKSEIIQNGKTKCIHYGELFTEYKELITSVVSHTDLENGVFSKKGDVLMPTSDVTSNGLARASALSIENVLLGGDINIIRIKGNLYYVFLSYFLNYDKYNIMRLVTGTTVKHIYASDIKGLKIPIPYLDEQRQIADFLSAIDDKISLLSNQIQSTEQYKKGLLQQMFV